jgi:steroid Delta-isomerase
MPTQPFTSKGLSQHQEWPQAVRALEPWLKDYARAYEALSPQNIDALIRLFSQEAVFRDPFHDLQGQEAIKGLFGRMFTQLESAAFIVEDMAIGQLAGFIKWDFTAQMPKRPYRVPGGRLFFAKQQALRQSPRGGPGNFRSWRIKGMSEVFFNAQGEVIAHIDHWDAAGQFYETLPVIGQILRILRAKIAKTVHKGVK